MQVTNKRMGVWMDTVRPYISNFNGMDVCVLFLLIPMDHGTTIHHEAAMETQHEAPRKMKAVEVDMFAALQTTRMLASACLRRMAVLRLAHFSMRLMFCPDQAYSHGAETDCHPALSGYERRRPGLTLVKAVLHVTQHARKLAG